MNNTILTPEEIALSLSKLQAIPKLSDCTYRTLSLLDLKWNLKNAVESQAIIERNKLPHNGMFHNSGNRKPFVDKVVKKFGKKWVRLSDYYKDKTSVEICIGNDKLQMYVFEDRIEVCCGFTMKLGLHSNFYDDLMCFLFDVGSEFYKLFISYNQLVRSLAYYIERYNDLLKPKNIKLALNDKNSYNDIREQYLLMLEELHPLREYVCFPSWERNFINLAKIESSLNEISRINARLTQKPENLYKYEKSYKKALDVLEKAVKYNLLSKKDKRLMVPWDDLIKSVAGDDSGKFLSDDGYVLSVAKAFELKLLECDKRNTAYMRKKKRKMEEDIELCKTLKSDCGLDCFIDRSQFDATVDHFNVVTDGNKTWVFRIKRAPVSIEVCMRYINIIKILKEIAHKVGKEIKFINSARGYISAKQHVNPSGIDEEITKSFREQIKSIKACGLNVTKAYVFLSLPVGGLYWQISMRRNVAEETISLLVPLIKKYLTLSNNGENFSLKGICEGRCPIL